MTQPEAGGGTRQRSRTGLPGQTAAARVAKVCAIRAPRQRRRGAAASWSSRASVAGEWGGCGRLSPRVSVPRLPRRAGRAGAWALTGGRGCQTGRGAKLRGRRGEERAWAGQRGGLACRKRRACWTRREEAGAARRGNARDGGRPCPAPPGAGDWSLMPPGVREQASPARRTHAEAHDLRKEDDLQSARQPAAGPGPPAEPEEGLPHHGGEPIEARDRPRGRLRGGSGRGAVIALLAAAHGSSPRAVVSQAAEARALGASARAIVRPAPSGWSIPPRPPPRGKVLATVSGSKGSGETACSSARRSEPVGTFT